MPKTRLHIVTVIVGFLLAVAVICTHVFSVNAQSEKNTVKTEKSSTDSDTQETILTSAPAISLPTSVSIHLNTIIYCLFEIELSTECEDSETPRESIASTRLFLTLFRVIISPNAP
jgi:hypothetical protein